MSNKGYLDTLFYDPRKSSISGVDGLIDVFMIKFQITGL